MKKSPPSRRRLAILLILLAGSIALDRIDWNLRMIGWPGAHILSPWIPKRLRDRAFAEFNQTAKQADISVIKAMLRAPDPHMRVNGVYLMNRIKGPDEFQEIARVTLDPIPQVRSWAYSRLPIPSDKALAIRVARRGLHDDSEDVVYAAARMLRTLGAKEALPDLIGYLRAKKRARDFSLAEVSVAQTAAEFAGLKMKFEEYKPSSGIKCVHAFIVTGRVVPKPLPRFERWLQDLVGNWFAQRDSLNYVSRPTHFKIADDVAKEDIAHRDQLLAWWARQNKHT